MDIQTLEFYATNAQEVAHRYELVESPLGGRFGACFIHGGRVLDVGCGSGRDLAELLRQGYEAFGVDGTPELLDLAEELHPELKGRVARGLLPGMRVPFGGGFDGVLCCAVLMHIDSRELAAAVDALKQCLRPKGRLLVSLPLQEPESPGGERDSSGRLFECHRPEHLRNLFDSAGFLLLDTWENGDALNRQGVEWYSQLYELQ